LTTDDLRAIASRIVERMVIEHPAEAAVLASLVLSVIAWLLAQTGKPVTH